jgi:DNA repair protein RadA/Sms
MGSRRTVFRCSVCGGAAPRWTGRCGACGEWNTLAEEPAVGARGPRRGGLAGQPAPAGPAAVRLADLAGDEATPRSTGLPEVDRVLGGGLVPGSVTLIAGEPGVGKSTLLLQLAAAVAGEGRGVLYVSAEESLQQVRRRGERLGAGAGAGRGAGDIWLAAATTLPDVLGHVAGLRPDVVVVDSIQTIHDPDIESAPGSVAQVRECAHQLVTEAKAAGHAVILVGHVTKGGSIAGPRVLEHVVDTVLSFEGDRHHGMRLLRAVKHRFGSTSELGVFEMTDGGLIGVPDASGLFLADRRPGVSGSAVVATVEGARPLLVEVQALVTPTNQVQPRRSAQGVDGGRLALLLAVLQRHLDLPVGHRDVFALAVGGARLGEPGVDLPLALAIASSMEGRSLPPDLVAWGEVGLGGEVRRVAHGDRRVVEAARLGFRRAVVPAGSPSAAPGLGVLRVRHVGEAIAAAGLAADDGAVRGQRLAG